MELRFLFLGVCISAVNQVAIADFELQFRFVQFFNHRGTLRRNHKCDTDPHPESNCDTKLTACISWPGKSSCFLNASTEVFRDQNSIYPEHFANSTSNLFTFQVDGSLPQVLELRVFAMDHDDFRPQVIENFTARISNVSRVFTLGREEELEMHPSSAGQKQLTTAILLRCDQRFYGHQCERTCGKYESKHRCLPDGTALCSVGDAVVTCVPMTTVVTTVVTTMVTRAATQSVLLDEMLPLWVFLVAGGAAAGVILLLTVAMVTLACRRKRVKDDCSVRPKLLREWSQVSAKFHNNTYVDNAVDLAANNCLISPPFAEPDYETVREKRAADCDSVYDQVDESALEKDYEDARSTTAKSECKSEAYRVPKSLPVDKELPDASASDSVSVQNLQAE